MRYHRAGTMSTVVRCPVCYRLTRTDAGCPIHPGAVAEWIALPEPEDRFRPVVPGYQLSTRLGQGGFAMVYLAHGAEGREVAIKVAHSHDDARFAREAAALRRVGPPTVPELHAEGAVDGGKRYLVMERLVGETLTERMARSPGTGAMPLGEVLPIANALCEALARVHEVGVVHRDLKPQNVFLCHGDRLCLLDFGLARGVGGAEELRAAAPDLTRTGERMGTVLYMSPEQCQEAREAGHRSDIYSFGVILFEMLCGRPPFFGDVATVMAAHAAKRPPRASELADLPPAIDEVFARCLAKPPAGRFGNAREVAQALERAAQAAGHRVPVARAADTAKTSTRRPVALLALRSRRPADQLAARLASDGAQLVRVHGDRYLFAFPGEPSPEAGVRAAARAFGHAAEQEEVDGVVHLADLRVREGSGGITVAGGPLERPAEWLPAEDGPGLRLTAAAAAVAGASIGERDPAGFVSLDTPTGSHAALTATPAGGAALVGRESTLEAAGQEGAACFSAACATLTTLVGETGLGRSRVLDALRNRLALVEVLATRARPPSAGDPEAVLRDLLRQGLGLAEGPCAAAEIERACTLRLGREQGESAWPAVALVLGALDESDARVRPILDAPGALRQTLARAAGSALRQLGQAGPLAVFVDDAHWADQASLDALEMCTLEGTPSRVWVCVAALPSLLELRPLWGERAGRAGQYSIGPLPPGPMAQLALELLRPVEFVPEPVVARLLEMTQGVPLYMVELVQALRAAGAIRRHRGTEEWYVAADEIPHVAPGAPAAALAGHAIAALPAHLASLAELCAVVGDEISGAEIDSITLSLPIDEASIDPAFGLPRLVRFGLLRRAGKGHFTFRHPMVREALEDRIAPARRRQLHRIVLEHLMHTGDRSRSVLERLARHAAECGESTLAADALLELAEEDRRRHRYVDAETHYSAALDELTADDPRREPICAGRGKVRYRLQRFQEALEDLESARRLAEARTDDAAIADLLLEEATVLDWSHQWPESAARLDQALPLVERVGDSAVAVRAQMARGRTFWRQDRAREALEQLSAAADRAAELGDYDTRTVALLLLAPALASAGRLEESEARFREVIASCSERGDALHLGVAYTNRVVLWMKRQNISSAADDQRRAIALARELGFGIMERISNYNLAELLHWLGKSDLSLEHARRSIALGERLNYRVAEDWILLSRVQHARHDYDDATARLDWVRSHFPEEQLNPTTKVGLHLADLLVRDARGAPIEPDDWEGLIAEVSSCSVVDEHVEVLHSAAKWAARRGHPTLANRWILEATRIAGDSPIWRSRLEAVSRQETRS